jgi:hypothetical protein
MVVEVLFLLLQVHQNNMLVAVAVVQLDLVGRLVLAHLAPLVVVMAACIGLA